MITGHGDDLYKYTGIRMNFSSNIYSHADLTALKTFLTGQLQLIGSYPEPQPFTLERMLAARHGVPAECVMVTNGATEAIYLIAQTFRNGVSTQGRTPRYTIRRPTFSEYEDALTMFGYEELEERQTADGNTIIWLCNPNNPTGEVLSDAEIFSLGDKRQSLYVIDQSYDGYTRRGVMSACDGVAHGNVIQIYSMTKTFAVPGLRLGYLVAAEKLIRRIRSQQHPWAVNALALAAGQYLLSHPCPAVSDLDSYLAEAQRLRQQLDAIEGLQVRPSETNFMLCRLENGSAADLKEQLAQREGILIRDASNFKGLDERYFRVAAQRPDENDTLVAAVQKYLKRER